MSKLSVGYARLPYTPTTPVPQNSVRTGKEVLTDVFVSCVALAFGEEKVLIYSNDLRGLGEDGGFASLFLETAMASSGLPEERLLITTTHNHSAPDVNYYGRREEMDFWVKEICMPAVEAVTKDALADLTPVTGLACGKAEVENVAFVRRYLREDGSFLGIQGSNGTESPIACHETEADRELRTLRFRREGKKDVLFVNFQVHAATAFSGAPEQVCADFLHKLRQRVEETGEISLLYLQGACGNLNTYSKLCPDACQKDFEKAGERIADGVFAALAKEKECAATSFDLRRDRITGIVDHTRDHLADKARACRAEIREKGLDDKTGREIYQKAGFAGRLDVAALLRKCTMEKTRSIPLSTLCIGEAAMIFSPCEMFDTNGIQLRAASPFDFTMTVCYTNRSHHYLPSAYAFSNGGYEVQQCYYIPGTGETMTLEYLRMLKEAKKSMEKKQI